MAVSTGIKGASTTVKGASMEMRSRLAEKRSRRRLRMAGAATVGSLPATDYEVVAYFPDYPTHLYQIRQWLEPLAELHKRHPVLLLTRSARSASALMPDCQFPVVYAAKHRDIDPLIRLQRLKVALYTSNNMRNAALLWHPDLLHVFIGHGESDKTGVSASNQLKAYDFCFVSGQASVDRMRHRLINYDTSARCIEAGRPQIDLVVVNPAFRRSGRTVVLYAPSWEGDRPASSYGSLASHGEQIVRSLLAAGQYQVIFRPHPLAGSTSSSFAAARNRIVALLERANQEDPSAGHLVDTNSDFGWQLQAADVCVADISAVTFDWLATRKPLVVTRPTAPDALVDRNGIAGRLVLLDADRAADAPEALRQAGSAQSLAAIDALATYYFGDTAPGASTARWLGAIDRVIELRDAAVAVRDAQPPTRD